MTFKDFNVKDPELNDHIFLHRALNAKPNAGHLAIAALNLPAVACRVIPAAISKPLHVTQNLDELSLRALQALPEDLTEAAAKRLIQIHGSLYRTRCLTCKHVRHSHDLNLSSALGEASDEANHLDIPVDRLPKCGGDNWSGSNRYGQCGGLLRPDVVWFGEVPPLMGEIARHITACDLLIIVGTSALVCLSFTFWDLQLANLII